MRSRHLSRHVKTLYCRLYLHSLINSVLIRVRSAVTISYNLTFDINLLNFLRHTLIDGDRLTYSLNSQEKTFLDFNLLSIHRNNCSTNYYFGIFFLFRHYPTLNCLGYFAILSNDQIPCPGEVVIVPKSRTR